MTLTCGSLFSGIGGLDLAAEWAGLEIAWQCEIDEFCRKVLKKHWPGVKQYDDITKLDGTKTRSVDIIFGGFPCQPYSHAGRRKGKEDDRALWPEMFRVIKELRPTWVVGENVAGHVTLGIDETLADLESEGYTCRTFVFPALAVNALHRRDRVFIVAHTKSYDEGRLSCRTKKTNSRFAFGCQDVANANSQRKLQPKRGFQELREWIGDCSKTLGNTPSERLPDWAGGTMGQPQTLTEFERPSGREIERDFRGVANGISSRVDRLKSLGNAVVPQQAYPIFQAIVDIEKGAIA